MTAQNPQSSTRIAMWSGPRNISTAMMRSWGARADCVVSDEPLYAHYLSTLDESKRAEHPVYQQVIESQDTDPSKLAAALTGPIPSSKPIWYQKHMAHHLTDSCGLDWLASLTNCILIREPAAMITSFIKVIDNPTPEDLGLPQLLRIFEWIRLHTNTLPVVLDSKDVLTDPAKTLNTLCNHIGVPFDCSMLAWEPGPRPEDGVWAPHWYASVYQSTGFSPYVPKDEPVPDRLRGVLEDCQAIYDQLAQHKL